MKRIITSIIVVCSVGCDSPLYAMQYMDAPNMETIARVCQTHPDSCFRDIVIPLGILGTLFTIIEASVYIHDHMPAIQACCVKASFFSCCKSKKQKRQEMYDALLERMPARKARKAYTLQVLQEEVPNSTRQQRRTACALLQQKKWNQGAAIAAAQHKGDIKVIALLKKI
ncbi:MAG: hypothetical protein AB7F19_00145 [Candidatus Babeliales bacterium]